MKLDPEYFDLKTDGLIPVDEFVEKILYHPNVGYYSKKIPFGNKGDFITAPTISNLFSEIITIWVITTWEKLGKPKNFNFVELGPGDGSLAKVFINTIKKFPNINKSINIYMYEKSNLLKKIQRKKLRGSKVKWIQGFDEINKGPVVFFGNEFFDAIPIKQFSHDKNLLKEKHYWINSLKGLTEVYKDANKEDIKKIKKFKVLKNLRFIEFPKLGFDELDKITSKVKKLSGGILLIDYGYLNILNKNTLQAVMENKKMDMSYLLKNLGRADITSLVNFKLLREYFTKNKLKVKKIVSQKFFLEKMGIIERAQNLSINMTFEQKNYMSLTLRRLLHKNLMGELFKVIFAFKSKKNNFLGFN